MNKDEIDLLEVVRAIWQGKWWIILATILGALVALGFLRTRPKIYQADLLLQIEQKDSSLNGLLSDISPLIQPRGTDLDSQIEIIKSRSLLGKTVKQFHLTSQLKPVIGLANIFHPVKNVPYSKINFQLTVPKDFVSSEHKLFLRVMEGNQWQLEDKGQEILHGKNGVVSRKQGYSVLFESKVNLNGSVFSVSKISNLDAIQNIISNLSITNIDKNALLRMKLDSEDPQYAILLLNSIASNYVASRAEQSIEKFQKGAQFIEQQLPQLRNRLEKSEQELSDFQAKNQTVDLGIEGKTLITALSDIESKLVSLNLKENELSSHYTSNHPEMRAIFKQREVLLSKKREIERQLEKFPSSSKGFLQLKRNVEVTQTIYLQLLSRLQELNVIKASAVGGVQIIDMAQSNNQVIKPKSKLILILFMLIGIIISSFIVIVRYFLDYKILSISDVQENTNLMVGGVIPFSKAQEKIKKKVGRHILAVSDPQDLSVEGLRTLRTMLTFSMKGKLLMITGPVENIGKSFISSNLAVLMAMSGKKVALVNLDLRRIFLDRQFDLGIDKSNIVNFLQNDNMDVSNCIHKTSVNNLYYLPAGEEAKHPSELLNSNRFNILMSYLRDNFDLVILDTPPVLAVSDALLLNKFSVETLLVIFYNRVSIRQLKLAINKIEMSKGNIISIVLNGVNRGSQDTYGKYYGKKK